jgi:hypothetical protein
MIKVQGFLILAGGLLVVGCATQGQSTSAAGHESVAAAEAAAPQPQSSQSAQSTSASGDADKRDETVTRGYVREVVRGQEMFCQREAQTGMRIMQKVCMTYDQLKDEQQRAKQLTTDLNRAQSNGRPQECRTMGSAAPC